MKFVATVTTSLSSLAKNPTRTILTMLGIVIGIASVITMMAIGKGSKNSIRASIEKMGANSVMIMPGSMQPPGTAKQGAGSAITLTPGDAAAIAGDCPSVGASSPVVRGTGIRVVFGNVNWEPANMYGVAPPYLDVRNWSVAEGRCFTPEEVENNARVCLVGSTVVREVFNNASPIGCELRLNEVTFEVIGVLKSKGANMMGMDEDDVVLTPWTTLQMRITGLKSGTASNTASTVSSNPGDRFAVSGVALYPEQDASVRKDKLYYPRFTQINQIVFAAVSSEKVADSVNEVSRLLRERHHLKAADDDDFHIRNSADFMSMLNQTSGLMTNLLLGVALISLVVGGVGIMNIMLVSVTERTREIGLRMAVGARSRDILRQFLIEAVVLCLAGGGLGIAIGCGAGWLVKHYAHWPVETSTESIIAAVTVSVVVGVIFGFYPAWKASRMDPIDALRYE